MHNVLLNPMVLTAWIIFSLVAGFMGTNKRLGFWGTFLASLVVSPIISIICLLIFQPRQSK